MRFSPQFLVLVVLLTDLESFKGIYYLDIEMLFEIKVKRRIYMSNMELKQNLTEKQLNIMNSEFNQKAKSKIIAYLFWFFLGIFGGHRFYLGDTKRAIFMLITLGGLGIWALIDVFFIGSRVEEKNVAIELEIIQNITD